MKAYYLPIILLFFTPVTVRAEDKSLSDHVADRHIQRTANAGLPDIRQGPPPILEVRAFFTIDYTDGERTGGYILKKTNSGWEAWRLALISDSKKGRSAKPIPIKPKTSWDEIWKELKQNDIFTIPDQSELKNQTPALGGISYDIEIRTAKHFRAYGYLNPQDQGSRQPFKNFLNIYKVFNSQFVDQ